MEIENEMPGLRKIQLSELEGVQIEPQIFLALDWLIEG